MRSFTTGKGAGWEKCHEPRQPGDHERKPTWDDCATAWIVNERGKLVAAKKEEDE